MEKDQQDLLLLLLMHTVPFQMSFAFTKSSNFHNCRYIFFFGKVQLF